MSRLQQDQFVDDEEEECCPLCVEEFDLSDRNFRPCPCGYQICQFCYNNIKTTMNGLCPACRRPYDDSTIEWKTISPEEMSKHKQQIAQKAKKNAQIRQKEAQKAEADTLSRKHLAGLRVVQKNLVYVTGLTPTIREDRLLDTLRGPDYFGQYGKIIKIVVSKARENAQHQQSVGVYVTFARKEDAEQCIKAVDGSANGDRQLRAQYGTTKYCSAYLRGEQCNNRNCMFLHEPGEDNDSFTRQDLSMMNSIQTQQPSQSSSSRAAPPAHPGPPVAAAVSMSRQDSNDTSGSSHDAPGLPATASWGSKAVLERRASRSTIASNPSPLVTNAVPAPVAKVIKTEEPQKKKGKEKEKKEDKEKEKEKEKDKSAQTSKSASPQRATSSVPSTSPATRTSTPRDNVFGSLLKAITSSDFKFVFSSAAFTEEEFKAICEFPQLLDPNGGAKRRAMREKEKELAMQREAETESKAPSHQASSTEREDTEATAGGSLQLGGEPEDGSDTTTSHLNHHAIAPPGQHGFGGSLFGQSNSLAEDFNSLGLSSRGMTTQQQQQLLSNFKTNSQSTPQTMQNQQPGLGAHAPGHARQTSRFSFANDSASASANVQPVANQKLMSQQNSMMPKNQNHFGQVSQHQPLGGQFFTNVQGPPPGLKPTGTPPVGGTSMFGQGHGFATGGLPYGANAAGRNSEAMYQDLLRSRNMDGGARVADAGKQDATSSVEEQASFNVDALVNETEPETEPMRSIPSTPMSAHFMTQPRRSTPTIPPGFTAPAVPRAVVEESKSRPGSRPMSRTSSATIAPVVPVVPVVPVTPIRAATPSKAKRSKQAVDTPPAPVIKAQPETPTKAPSKTGAAKTPSAASIKGSEDGSVQKKQQQQKAEEKKPVLDATIKETPRAKGNKKSSGATDASPKKTAKEIKAELKEAIQVPVATPASSSKRQPPGKLDITAATQVPVAEQSPGQAKNARATPATATTSVPASPAAAATGSPIKRTTAPRTLRVVPTPKTEAPPPLSATAPSMPQISTVEKLRSRQASIASVNLPGTPASEMISDTASVTSASISRASSPPPIGGKVGTAPVRKKTKSQAKKDRQERKRQIEEDMALEENKSDVEVVQAPIIGRKKKSKKPTTVPKIVNKSQPASPKPATVEDEVSDAPAPIPVVVAKTPQTPKTPKTPTAATPDPEHFPDSKEKREHTAQSILADLQKTGELLASTLEFFKPLSSSLTHASRCVPTGHTSGPPDLKIHFSEADLEAIAKKKPVRLTGHDDKADSRTLITPNGKFFWGLSEELEEKALQLEKQIEELRGHARFHPRKQSGHSHSYSSSHPPSKDVLPAIATALKEAGKKLGATSTQQMPKLDVQSVLNEAARLPPPMPQPQDQQQAPPPPQQQQQPPQTPTDAGAYLNQFVLPKTDNPPPNQPRPEMAAVGGAPGAGTANISVNAGKFAKAAKAVVEGGAVGSTEIDGMGMMAADLLGGVFVQGLEALVGAGLGFESSSVAALQQEFGLDADGNITIGRGGAGALDVQGLMSAIGNAGGFGTGDFGGNGGAVGGAVGGSGASRFGRGSVMSLDEAERAMHAAKKEHDVLEKKLAALMKKNKKLFGGMGKV